MSVISITEGRELASTRARLRDAVAIMRELKEWEIWMGGWDNPAWRQLHRFIAEYDKLPQHRTRR